MKHKNYIYGLLLLSTLFADHSHASALRRNFNSHKINPKTAVSNEVYNKSPIGFQGDRNNVPNKKIKLDKGSQSTRIEDLHPGLLPKILGYLPSKVLARNATKVSKHFKQAVKNCRIWRSEQRGTVEVHFITYCTVSAYFDQITQIPSYAEHIEFIIRGL